MATDEFGAWLQRERERRDLRVEDAASAFGVSPQSVYSWERGVTRPQPLRFVAIERAYQLVPGTLAGMLGLPLSGSPLNYWVARWAEVTTAVERATRGSRAASP